MLEHGVGHHHHHQTHTQGAIDRLDAHIGEPAAGIDRREIGLQLGAGDQGTRGGRHGRIGRQFEPLPLGMVLQPLDRHLGDQDLGLGLGCWLGAGRWRGAGGRLLGWGGFGWGGLGWGWGWGRRIGQWVVQLLGSGLGLPAWRRCIPRLGQGRTSGEQGKAQQGHRSL